MVLKTSAGAPITCSDWDDLVDIDGFLALGRNRYHCSYVIYRIGTYYYAENGTTGNLDYGGPTSEGATDGTKATDVIQAAITNLPSGGLIFIKNGTYVFDALVNVMDNITLIGESRDTVTMFQQANTDSTLFRIANQENVTIKNMTLDLNSDNQAAPAYCISIGASTEALERFRFENIIFIGGDPTNGAGIGITTSAIDPAFHISDVRVRDCYFTGFQYGIIGSGNIHKIWIEDNIFNNDEEMGSCVLLVNDNGANSNIWIRKNRLIKFYSHGITVQQCTNLHIEANYLEGTQEFWTDAVSGGTADMIKVTNGCNDFEVVDNTTYRSGDMGITIENDATNGTISGNKVSEADARGINLVDVSAVASEIVVTENICWNNGQNYSVRVIVHIAGIMLQGASNIVISDNMCYDDQGVPTQNYGIKVVTGAVVDSDYNLIHDNYLWGNAIYGVGIGVNGAENWVEDNYFMGNVTGAIEDLGTNTKLAVKVFQFTEPLGTAAWQLVSPTGILVNAAAEGALAQGEAPLDVQEVVRFRVKGVCLGATGAGKGMLLEININAGKPAGSEAYNAEAIAVASVISTEDNVAINDAIEWVIDATDDVDVDDIRFGETIELFSMFEDTGADSDIATNAVLRTISMEYV